MKYLKSLILFLLPIASVVGGKELFEWMGGVPNMTAVGVLLMFAIIIGINLAIGFLEEQSNKE